MNPVHLSCEGIEVGCLWIPPFVVKQGDWLCLHLPAYSREAREPILQVLTGQRPVPGLHLFGRVAWARPATRAKKGLAGVLGERKVVDWLNYTGGISWAEAGAIVERLGLCPDWRVSRLPGTPKTLLGLEAAWARGADVVVFETAGLDPVGRQRVQEAISSRLDRCAALHLSYTNHQNGRMERDCFPGETCIDLQERSSASLSRTPGPG
jgi:hypothetical protein